MFQHHSQRALTHLRRNLLIVVFVIMAPPFQELKSPANPSAVHCSQEIFGMTSGADAKTTSPDTIVRRASQWRASARSSRANVRSLVKRI